ncbi:Methyltransferase domain-containing protein [Desulfatibacillum alkenivorans DSM 16219]|uniref:Methyltransferase domain-containing protein n=2 Tax=Desulfatibacillum alkenivorans TaxID=259354 RepID=A0A1M6VSA2_9BACT|nr:Methyltransferase domain-containing protein [Desulfatibacillum alkenivorans DSM 16219]
MPMWILAPLALLGGLFLIKFVYVVCTAMVLPKTRGALFVATPQARVKAFLESMPMEENALFIDLGCGDGRVISGAVKKYGVRAVGYDLNPLALLTAKTRNLFSSRAKIKACDFFRADLSQADYVFCYLFPDVMHDLSQKLKDELKPGAKAASANFPLPGWSPYTVIKPKGALNHDPIYLYEVEE